jgi:anti-sigma B factor antagonist
MGFFYIGDEAPAEVAHHGDDVVVLVAGGELDYAASPQIRDHLRSRIDAGMRRLVLDLSGTTFIDSTAIGVLVAAVMQLQELDGGSLAVVCAEENRRVLRIFEIAGVDSLIALHRTREEALAELAVAG